MTTRDSREQAAYVGQTDDELTQAPTVFRDGLLRGQVVLVSGGGGGIGRAICYLFGVAEACVYLSAPSGRFITAEVLTLDGGGQAWGEFWPLGKPAHFRVED